MQFFKWWNKPRLLQLIIAMQTACALAFAFYLAYQMKTAFNSSIPYMFMENRSLPFHIGIACLVLAPMARTVIIALAVLWWLAQQRKIIERSGGL